MGIFKSLKNLFSNDIDPEITRLSGIVYPYVVKGGKIKLNSKLKVPENFCCVLGSNGKSLDYFTSGAFTLGIGTLPECGKKLKLNKTNNGKPRKSFKADVYFVALREFEYSWQTFEKAELGKRGVGIFTVGAEGKIQLCCNNASKLLENLLNEFAYLKVGEAEKIIKSWLSDIVVRTLYKYNFALSEFLNNDPNIEQVLFKEISLVFNKLGMKVTDFKIEQYKLPKKFTKAKEKEEIVVDSTKEIPLVQENHSEITANELKPFSENETNEDMPNKSPLIDIQDYSNKPQIKTAEILTVNKINKTNSQNADYVPFGSFVIENCDEQEITEKIEEINSSFNEPSDNSEVEFVDLNINNIVNNNENTTKRCLNCGAQNGLDADKCVLCGEKF